MSDARLEVRIHSEIMRRFKMICSREGDTMSKKIRRFIISYITEHEDGNPQTLLKERTGLSIQEQILDESANQEHHLAEQRRGDINDMAIFCKVNSSLNEVEMIKGYAVQSGHTESKAREYLHLLKARGRIKRKIERLKED